MSLPVWFSVPASDYRERQLADSCEQSWKHANKHTVKGRSSLLSCRLKPHWSCFTLFYLKLVVQAELWTDFKVFTLHNNKAPRQGDGASRLIYSKLYSVSSHLLRRRAVERDYFLLLIICRWLSLLVTDRQALWHPGLVIEGNYKPWRELWQWGKLLYSPPPGALTCRHTEINCYKTSDELDTHVHSLTGGREKNETIYIMRRRIDAREEEEEEEEE